MRILGARVHIFVLGRHLGFSSSGGLGEEIFAEEVGVKWSKWARGEGEGKKKIFKILFFLSLPRLCTNPLPVKRPVTIQDSGIEPIYLAFRISLPNNACTAGYAKTETQPFIVSSAVLHSRY